MNIQGTQAVLGGVYGVWGSGQGLVGEARPQLSGQATPRMGSGAKQEGAIPEARTGAEASTGGRAAAGEGAGSEEPREAAQDSPCLAAPPARAFAPVMTSPLFRRILPF